jgi:diguanylate cyclase
VAAAAPPAAPRPSAAELAKAAFRRLAQQRLEPTPEHFSNAYAAEAAAAGVPVPGLSPPAPAGAAADAPALPASAAEPGPDAGNDWSTLTEQLLRETDRGGREWTQARRKASVQRVLAATRAPAMRLQRLQALLAAWRTDSPDRAADADAGSDADADSDAAAGALASPKAGQGAVDPEGPATPEVAAPAGSDAPALLATAGPAVADAAAPLSPAATPPEPGPAADAQAWAAVAASLQAAVQAALVEPDDGSAPPPAAAAEPSGARQRAAALADRLAALHQCLERQGPTPTLLADVQQAATDAARWLGQRHRLVQGLATLAREMAGSLAELSEDDSWARGQCEALAQRLQAPPSARGVRAAASLLAQTRRHQQRLLGQRQQARDALKVLIGRMLSEVGGLDDHTGRFHEAVAGHVRAISAADSLPGLADVVRQLLEDSRTVQQAVAESRRRLQDDRSRAQELQDRVQALEAELRRLSDEVGTDPLTQVANRRGLGQAFDALSAQAARDAAAPQGGPAQGTDAPGLAVALIDIDNFKRLNDTLGHAAGDEALRSLAAAVGERLRPADHLARFGGEEFVVLMPATALLPAQQALTRLQRSLSAALFMHDGREVFVTFSAGVTHWRPGEPLEATLERADQGLYEAKRTGKNRTCLV